MGRLGATSSERGEERKGFSLEQSELQKEVPGPAGAVWRCSEEAAQGGGMFITLGRPHKLRGEQSCELQ